MQSVSKGIHNTRGKMKAKAVKKDVSYIIPAFVFFEAICSLGLPPNSSRTFITQVRDRLIQLTAVETFCRPGNQQRLLSALCRVLDNGDLVLAFAGIKNADNQLEVFEVTVEKQSNVPLATNTVGLFRIYEAWAKPRWPLVPEEAHVHYQLPNKAPSHCAPLWLQVESTAEGDYLPYSESSIKQRQKDLWMSPTIQACLPEQAKLPGASRPYDIRSHCSSTALHFGASLEQVLSQGGWRGDATFKSKYLREVPSWKGPKPPSHWSLSAKLRWNKRVPSNFARAN